MKQEDELRKELEIYQKMYDQQERAETKALIDAEKAAARAARAARQRGRGGGVSEQGVGAEQLSLKAQTLLLTAM